MDTDQYEFIDGINLDDYYPYERTFDTVLYVHKKTLNNNANKTNIKKVKAEPKKVNTSTMTKGKSESLVEQTVRFAKQLAPIAIPPDERSNAPVFYTVKACSRCKRKESAKKTKRKCIEENTYKKEKCKKIIESFKKERCHASKNSNTESEIQSSTLDDINQSLTCTISEQSVKREKCEKNENNKRKKKNDKFIISDSFEAMATEITNADDSKIKVHLMNSAEKRAFRDSIKSPVLNAVRKYMSEFNNGEVTEEVRDVQRSVKCNTDKLDKILDKLAYIEKYLKNNTQVRTILSPRQPKVSTLEQLGEDFDEEKSFEEECGSARRREYEDNRVENLGCGEAGIRASTSVGVRADKNRIPARFCWTDGNKDRL